MKALHRAAHMLPFHGWVVATVCMILLIQDPLNTTKGIEPLDFLPTLSVFMVCASTTLFALAWGARWSWIGWVVCVVTVLLLFGERLEIHDRAQSLGQIYIDAGPFEETPVPTWVRLSAFLPWLAWSIRLIAQFPARDTVFWVCVGMVGLASINFLQDHLVLQEYYQGYNGSLSHTMDDHTSLAMFALLFALPVWGPAFAEQTLHLRTKVRVGVAALWFVFLWYTAIQMELRETAEALFTAKAFQPVDAAAMLAGCAMLLYSAWKGSTFTRCAAWLSISTLALVVVMAAWRYTSFL
jgi:hypothetical protein